MKMKLLSILLIIATFSCAPFKKFEKNKSRIGLSSENLELFNGQFELISIDSAYRFLDFALLAKSPFGFENIPEAGDYLSLKVLDKKKIEVSVYEDDNLIRRKVLKGKIKDNYFVFRKRRVLIFWLVLNGIRIQKSRIGLLENGNLILDNSGGGILLLVFLPAGGNSDEFHNLQFRKIE